MRESYQNHTQKLQHHQNHRQARGSSRLGLRTSGTAGVGGGGCGGEIVEVQGGHIVRSTSRKDRHSKVCTAKGPRDRRVRLSAHTAIQFYDVQDRLGYDRPSKAVDWLIKKAKTAIDKLAELPAWKPTATTNPNSISTSDANFEQKSDQLNHLDQLGNSQNSSFLPVSLDSDSIGSSNLFSRTSSLNQDLRLSLQSFQDPILHHHHRPETQQANDNGNFCFDGSGWSDNPPGGFQRTVAWGGDNVSAVSGGFVFGSQPPNPPAASTTPFLQPLFGQTIASELFNSSQREPLQSSIAPSFRAWIDPLPPFTGVAIDQHPTLGFHRPCSGLGGFSGLGVPARMEGEHEEHDGVSDRPSSASSDSHH